MVAGTSHVDDYPEIPVSLRSTVGVLQTGAWRNLRPVLTRRTAPCTAACPAGVPVPHYLDLLARGRVAEAVDLFHLSNPFPRITGRVCPHPCESECNRAHHDGAVSIRALERHLGDATDSLPRPTAGLDSGHTVAVVGSGPAGLSAAHYLRREGHAVIVHERRELPGGLLRYGIPDYRLPDPVVDAEISALRDMGVEFRTGVSLGSDITLAGLENEYEAVFVAIGAWSERWAGIDGEEAMVPGLDFLNSVAMGETTLPGRHCAVVGGGNTAMDVARVLLRLGADAAVLYRRTEDEMPAIAEEYERAAEDGVRFEFLSLPVAATRVNGEIQLTVAEMRLGPADESGRHRPEPTGVTHTETYDAVFTAIGESADLAAFPTAMVSDDGWLQVAPDGQTTHETVYVGGDLSHGPETVIAAIADGRRAAAAIHGRLNPGAAPPPWSPAVPEEVVGHKEVNGATVSSSGAIHLPHMEPAERIAAGFVEEAATIAAAAALAEVERCYSCGHCNSCGVCFTFCPDVAIAWDDGPTFDLNVCKGCGICATECPGSAIINVPEKEFARV